MGTYAEAPSIAEAVQVPNREWGDSPFEGWAESPQWLIDFLKQGVIYPKFLGEDYYYFIVPQWALGLRNAGPDSWIVYKGDSPEKEPMFEVLSNEEFKVAYKEIVT